MSTNDPQITTYSGRQFFINRATVDDIYIEDIAHGLSNVCRYVGQCKTFYSVAEHSVRMAEMSWGTPMKLLALLHDAAEAYLGDVSTEVKHCLPTYMEMETRLTYVIFDRYSIRHCPLMNFDIDSVKYIDAAIRTPEVTSLFPTQKHWKFSWTKIEYAYGHIRPWSPKKAERKFLKMFKELYKEGGIK